MGETDLTKDQVSGEVIGTDLPGTVSIPVGIDADLVKSLYNSFCDRCVEAGMDGPPRWT